jgi:hypothetical protein
MSLHSSELHAPTKSREESTHFACTRGDMIEFVKGSEEDDASEESQCGVTRADAGVECKLGKLKRVHG